VRVFLSAAPAARQWTLPEMVGGFEADIEDDAESVPIVATYPVSARTLDPAVPLPSLPTLAARPTGRENRGLPWWEVVIE
jgi:hypothetical protein